MVNPLPPHRFFNRLHQSSPAPGLAMHGQHQLQIRAAVCHGAAGPHKTEMLRFLAMEMLEVWILPGKMMKNGDVNGFQSA